MFGVCIDNEDPKRAARVRLVEDKLGTNPLGDAENDTAILIKKGLLWTRKDPYVHAPFLPLHLNIVPKIGEAVKIIYYDPENEMINKEYIGPVTSLPHKLFHQAYRNGRLWSSRGGQVKVPPLDVTDGEYSTGVFASPRDIAINGRNNTDIVLGMGEKLPVESNDANPNAKQDFEPESGNYPQILIRSAKYEINPPPTHDTQPKANTKQTFIQLSTFPDTLKGYKNEDEIVSAGLDDQRLSVFFEYDIQNGQDPVGFLDPAQEIDFMINLSLIPTRAQGVSQAYMCSKVNRKTNFLFTDSILTAKFRLTQGDAAKQINNILTAFDQENFTDLLKEIPGSTAPTNFGFSPATVDSLKQKLESYGVKRHPLYFRPGSTLMSFCLLSDYAGAQFSSYGNLNAGNFGGVKKTIESFTRTVKLSGVLINGKDEGYGLAFTRNPSSRGIKEKTDKVTTHEAEWEYDTQQGFIALGSEKIYLFSHTESELGHIELNTNYGVSQEKFIDDIEDSTQSLVRGEKLVDLLELMGEFLMSHAHNPCEGPIPTSWGGTTIKEIETKLKKFRQDGLNSNIRIN
tara:strand:- start:2722 stop:4431 length:1710 start_codon:yes stop_codon:yes gene_type:complete